jgi:hypothetical protein
VVFGVAVGDHVQIAAVNTSLSPFGHVAVDSPVRTVHGRAYGIRCGRGGRSVPGIAVSSCGIADFFAILPRSAAGALFLSWRHPAARRPCGGQLFLQEMVQDGWNSLGQYTGAEVGCHTNPKRKRGNLQASLTLRVSMSGTVFRPRSTSVVQGQLSGTAGPPVRF